MSSGGEACGLTAAICNETGVRLHVVFTVDDLGGGRSRVGVGHSGFADAPAEVREAASGGWSYFLPRLAEAA